MVLLWPLVVAWPLPLVLREALLCAPDQEAATHVWGHWAAWVQGRPLRLDGTLMAWPTGIELVLIDPLAALVAGPALLLDGPALGYNLLVWTGLVLAGLTGLALARRLGTPPVPTALLAATCPTLVANTADGMTEGFLVALVVLQAVLLLDLRDRPGPGRLLAAGLAAGATAWAGPYNAVWAGILDLGILVWALGRHRAAVPWLAGALALGGAVMGPVAVTIFTARAESLPGGAARAGLPAVVENPAIFRGGVRTGADLSDPFLPGLLTGGVADPSHTAYLGLGVLLLAGWAAWRQPRLRPWLAGALGFALLSFGPWLYLGGRALRVGGAPLAGPAGLLMLALPPLARLSRWYRAGAVASLLLAPVAAAGLARLARPRLRGLVLVGLLADLLLLAPLAWPLHTSRPPPAWPLEGPGAVLELPPVTTGQPPPGAWRDVGALAQVQHGRPVGGAFMGLGVSEAARTATALLRDGLRENTLDKATLDKIRARGFRWLAVHRRHISLPAASLARLRCAGRVVVSGDDALVVDLEAPPAAACPAPPH